MTPNLEELRRAAEKATTPHHVARMSIPADQVLSLLDRLQQVERERDALKAACCYAVQNAGGHLAQYRPLVLQKIEAALTPTLPGTGEEEGSSRITGKDQCADGSLPVLTVGAQAVLEQPIGWAKFGFIRDSEGRDIGMDEPEVSWGPDCPDDESRDPWLPLYAKPTAEQPDLAEGEAAALAPSHTDLMVTPETIGPWLARDEAAKVICDFMGWPDDPGPAYSDALKLFDRLRPTPPIKGGK